MDKNTAKSYVNKKIKNMIACIVCSKNYESKNMAFYNKYS